MLKARSWCCDTHCLLCHVEGSTGSRPKQTYTMDNNPLYGVKSDYNMEFENPVYETRNETSPQETGGTPAVVFVHETLV